MVVKLVGHCVGIVAGWLAFTLQGLVAYAGLRGYAVIAGTANGTGCGIGSWSGAGGGDRSDGTFLVLVAAVVGAAVVLLVIMPAAVLGAYVRRDRQWFARTMGVLGIASALMAGYFGVAVPAARLSIGQAAAGWLLAMLSLLFPLGVYTGFAYGVPRALTNRRPRGRHIAHRRRPPEDRPVRPGPP